MRTKVEIEKEIAALKTLRPVGTFRQKTAGSIAVAIEELAHGVDRTSAEWDELTDSEQDAVRVACDWKEGTGEDKPSEGWGALVG